MPAKWQHSGRLGQVPSQAADALSQPLKCSSLSHRQYSWLQEQGVEKGIILLTITFSDPLGKFLLPFLMTLVLLA